MDQKLRKRERITKRKDIEHLFAEGARCSRAVLRATALRNGLDYSRLGVGPSSKLCNAVKRNRLKRLTREAFRLNKADLPTGLDLFVMPTRVKVTLDEMTRDLVDAARELDRKLGEK